MPLHGRQGFSHLKDNDMKPLKRYVALARVSSREQEREGFSLDIQVDALNAYALRNQGEIVRLFRIAETASKFDERKTFKELLAYAKSQSHKLDGLLFYKVDRAARNLFDYVELERLESESGIQFISVSQPTESTPAGRMQRRMLASMASFYTEQQSLEVREGLARRVQNGLFISKPPFGYKNVRINGRSIIEIDDEQAAVVQRAYELYAFKNHSLDSLADGLVEEGCFYSKSKPKFTKSKLHKMLVDRAYIGEVRHKGEWYPGTHQPLIERSTWNRVQSMLGQKTYKSHQMTYGAELIACGHCGYPITSEMKTKQTKTGEHYTYYRCTKYQFGDHPRIRLREAELDAQLFILFDKLRVQDDDVRQAFRDELRKTANWDQRVSAAKAISLQDELTQVRQQQNSLLNMRMLEEIDADTFANKNMELRDRTSELQIQIVNIDRGRNEIIDTAMKAFELSQDRKKKWVTADYAAKRTILEILCLNWILVDVSLVPEIRKPFDLLVEGLDLKDSRGERIRTSGLLHPMQAR